MLKINRLWNHCIKTERRKLREMKGIVRDGSCEGEIRREDNSRSHDIFMICMSAGYSNNVVINVVKK